MSRLRSGLALSVAAASLVLGCKIDPDTPELVYSLNEGALAENPALAERATARAKLDGALQMLFGTPSAPAYLTFAEWTEDEEFYPNFWGLDSESDEAHDQRLAENREYFAQQLEALEAGRWDELDFTRYAPDLWEDWQAHYDLLFGEEEGSEEEGAEAADEPPDPEMVLYQDDDGNDVTWYDEAVALFENYYPRMTASAEMYRQQCFHCHGASGGGDGSTAPYLNPRPRDYRPGKFKFTALADKARPRHEDLVRILHEGVYTTAMPSFARFPRSILSGLADYVRLLAVRGETEILTIGDYDDYVGLELDKVVDNYKLVVERWREADDKLIAFEGDVPESTPERVERGRALFMNAQGANCVSCHGVTGRGDGLSAWETGKEGEEYAKDEWGDEIAPRDLTRGVYRFGRRPIDLYRRIHAGINGTPMPGHYDMQVTEPDGTTRRLDEEDIWDLVFYVRALPELSGRAVRHRPNADGDQHAGDQHAGDQHDEEGH